MIATNEQLKIIETCNPDYDGEFYYGVKTTRIFCKPSCRSRMPKPGNIVIYQTVEEMLDHNFIPCKRCKPTDTKLPNESWIEQVTHYIDYNLDKKLLLKDIADECHGSPYHLHRTFKSIMGFTIREYTQRQRLNKAQQLIVDTNIMIKDIGEMVGIPNRSQFSREFKRRFKVTPLTMRRQYSANY